MVSVSIQPPWRANGKLAINWRRCNEQSARFGVLRFKAHIFKQSDDIGHAARVDLTLRGAGVRIIGRPDTNLAYQAVHRR